jgi:dolichyl-phosphate beta-glucosyltransferase
MLIDKLHNRAERGKTAIIPLIRTSRLTTPFLSLIIPAYNEEGRLPSTLAEIDAFLRNQPYSAEVLVVENGSWDRTYEIAQHFASQHSNFQVLHEAGRGKGLAIRRGMLEAKGEYRFMCDTDLSMPISEINCFFPPALNDFDIAIASREASGAVRYDEPAYRHLGGRLINLMIRLLILPDLNDTQCGFKCFRAPVAEDLFHRQTLTSWSFDIEILYIAQQRGYKVVEIPIPWYFNRQSKLNPISDAFRMGMDILSIRRNQRRGLYG